MEADTSIKLPVKQITEQQVKIAQLVYNEATETYGDFSAVMAFVFDITHR